MRKPTAVAIFVSWMRKPTARLSSYHGCTNQRLWLTPYQACNHFREFLPRDHPGAKTFQVFGIDLAIYQFNTFLLKILYILYKRIFAGIACLAEHAFSKEDFAHSYTV